MAQEAASRGLYLRPRYSPGCGDFGHLLSKGIFLTVFGLPKADWADFMTDRLHVGARPNP